MSTLPGIDEALALVLAHARVLDAEEVPIGEAAGRVLAAPAVASVDLPPFRSSAMDGYAVRAASTPGRLTVVGASAAGAPYDGGLRAGEAVVISTGAVVPDDADAVVPVERTTRDGDAVLVEEIAPSAHVRPRGGDARTGDVIATSGTVLSPARVGALAAVGIARVSCARRPRVCLLATGSELRPPGSELGPGQIYESNTVLLAAQVRSTGGVVELLPAVADRDNETRDAIAAGLAADLLITSGGVSVGPHDLVRSALADLGAQEIFWRVAVRPGKPVAFAVRGETLVFGLPGNPVSSLVGFELFVRPALLALQGAAPGPHYLPGRLGAAVRRTAERDELIRARLAVEDGAVILEPLTGQESHMIARSAAADALVLVPRGDGELARDASVRYLRI